MSNKYVPNSFQVANAFVDEAMSKLSDASVKIYLIINRKTRGWAKECDALSISQLEDLSGKSHPTVVKCTKELVRVGLVKLHEQSVYGKVYSLIDNYYIGEMLNFSDKKSLLIQSFRPFNGQLVKIFNYPKMAKKKAKKGRKISMICVNFAHKKNVLVKKFNYLNSPCPLKFLTTASKNFLPLLVKIFNIQNTLSKPTNQNKKKNWFVLETLKSEIVSIDNSFDTNEIFNASWFERELDRFEKFNQDRKHSDYDMVKFFAEWMLKARVKYVKMKPQAKRVSTNKISAEQLIQSENLVPDFITFASDKQVLAFARRLANNNEVAEKYSNRGESWPSLAQRIAVMLIDPEQQKPFIPHLIALGFKGSSKGCAA